MLQVLNSKERNQAFLQFLLFFLITVMLAIGAVYFNFRVPEKENKLLREEVDMQRTESQNQQKFVSHMQQAKVLLDSMKKSQSDINLVDMQLTAKMNELLNLQQKDSSLYGKLNNAVVDAFLELQRNKKELIGLNEKAASVNELKAELTKCQEDLTTSQGQLDVLRKGTGF